MHEKGRAGRGCSSSQGVFLVVCGPIPDFLSVFKFRNGFFWNEALPPYIAGAFCVM